MGRLVTVSNRLPVTFRSDAEGGFTLVQSTGGLATGLSGPHGDMGGLWIGWPGDLDGLPAPQRVALDDALAAMRTVPVSLTAEEVEGFYAGFSNGVLWPLFHYLLERLPYHSRDWDAYRHVNEKYADAVCASYARGDVVWVHDYHLMLVPALVRARIPNARIGFFLHIPFPAADVFRIVPWRNELLRGLLGADLIGFHTSAYAHNFAASLVSLIGIVPDIDRVRLGDRTLRYGVFPMGIDARFFSEAAADPDVVEQARAMRRENNAQHLLFGIDRLDYTKGIPRRLMAIERLLEMRPELVGKIRFVQVAVPSREDIAGYDTFVGKVHQMVGRINGIYSTPVSAPVHFIHKGFSQRELVAMYLAADVMVVTPLRDGMNLVAKEFVASRVDEDGVLVLSELAGAAAEMGEAVIVNPYDIDAVARALADALEMPRVNRQKRMRALRERVIRFDVHRWATSFIASLNEVTSEGGRDSMAPQPPDADDRILEALGPAHGLVVVLDYDGTLVPFGSRPELAEPDRELLDLLYDLCERADLSVHIVSGRKRETLAEWFDDSDIGLHSGGWKRNLEVDASWKGRVRPILERATDRLSGSFIEEKSASLAWHFRLCDTEHAAWQSRELQLHLTQALSNVPVSILLGDKVIEIQPHGVDKGRVVRTLRQEHPSAAFLALGDDETDESMFEALPDDGIAVHVGPKSSRAPYRLPDHKAARALLRRLLT
ncbi:MAG: bifunctional alpha,alpha-trehalose-phosphate synthase (UDP-forming)/trehalose-phosphatase [Proteobacteria bacterium]|jgi:trehalose 6-phosphate synthase/phosphatase|nr:bifunctional alpha,alpha-trehalose-phosphate synthase (UDP-forming)/trehalose-phosphatase [Pseudomonadota bacterium]